MSWVLVEPHASARQGKILWFKQMTGIGPMTTPNKDERAVFETRDEAICCPALTHSLSFYEVREVGVDDESAEKKCPLSPPVEGSS